MSNEDFNPPPVSNSVSPPSDPAPVIEEQPALEVSNGVSPPASEPVPEIEPATGAASVTLWQARTVIRNHGLFDAVDAYITAHKDDIPQAYEVWNYGNAVSRTSPLIAAIGAQLGLTDAQIDALFEEAAAITA